MKKDYYNKNHDLDSKQKDVFIDENLSHFIDCLMIGDGHIQKTGRIILVSAYKDFFYSLFKFRMLRKLISENGKIYVSNYFDKRTNKFYSRTNITTITTKSILQKRKKWYPNDVKIIPKDIIIDEQLISILLLDDGYFVKNDKSSLACGICLNSFTYEEIKWFCLKAFQEFGLLFNINKTDIHNQYRIKGSTDCSIAIFCILEEYIKFYNINSEKYINIRTKIFDNEKLIHRYKEIKNCFNENGKMTLDLYSKKINRDKYFFI